MSPRNVRPSWIDLNVDGRDTGISTGPRSRTGQMSAVIYVRLNGDVHKAIEIDLLPDYAGATVRVAVRAEGQIVFENIYTQ